VRSVEPNAAVGKKQAKPSIAGKRAVLLAKTALGWTERQKPAPDECKEFSFHGGATGMDSGGRFFGQGIPGERC